MLQREANGVIIDVACGDLIIANKTRKDGQASGVGARPRVWALFVRKKIHPTRRQSLRPNSKTADRNCKAHKENNWNYRARERGDRPCPDWDSLRSGAVRGMGMGPASLSPP
jgi:hypothetical protein